ncbi:DUF1289 domain-containing protein [Acidithiobacillus ferridurans]|uniref:DUF1289 domain-containing protein n=1 Tax=Acidithiobacillus ferridurans TaxID=1232575 RepID=A0A8X8G9V8_ACIFI|nr:DUF1289 domain-containing protein [Acidithiobacillus ferridurans]MBU2715858.1 DUF1289 domain-containing protein [Acidithiobacillus ferridurans]MBU2723420.1 DUF1289 domain-containing protein [Acidithiobacillus ferridurans]MBU2728047.1 DUF1289 domain-containing protein [Acidithiobacillus ferridurans]MDA8378034.1 DUF1289 domain-containing protein [Planctomycetia bacterium]
MSISGTSPDSPCLGFCTTALGDDVCKSCGRTEEEVLNWITMTKEQKASVWERLLADGWQPVSKRRS